MKLLVILLSLLAPTLGLNILTVCHHSMKSHYAICKAIMETLLDAGHHVTAVTFHKEKSPHKNYRNVQVPDVMDLFTGGNDTTAFDFGHLPALLAPALFPFIGFSVINRVMESTELEQFLNRKEQFDICILELFMGESLLGIAEQSGCSVIQYTTFDAFMWSDSILGNISPTSHVPHSFLHYSDKMTFTQRLWNTFFILVDSFSYKYVSYWLQKYAYNKYFPNAERSFDEMYKNTSLIFINNHVSSSFVRPLMPTQIEIGGIHVKPIKALPLDLQSFLDDATDGVIFFSMGSYIDGVDWKLEHREAFLKSFGKLKQKVIWRYSNDTLPGNPGNIRIGSWFPQRDILAHKNVKLFITHGGLLGTTEAIVEGVPVLGIPVFGDQRMNMIKTVTRGYGLQIEYSKITEEILDEALNELLTNPVYRENAKLISKRFIDRPKTPQQEVVYWTEFIARHHGAAHLQASSVQMNFIQLNQLDVYGFIVLCILLIVYVNFKLTKILAKKLLGSDVKEGKKKIQ